MNRDRFMTRKDLINAHALQHYSQLLVNLENLIGIPNKEFISVFTGDDLLNTLPDLKSGKSLGPDHIGIEYLLHSEISVQLAK